MMQDLIEQIKKTIVFLGGVTQEGQPQLCGTGFLVGIEQIFHLVTAKHVVADPKTGKLKDDGMLAFFNLKSGEIGSRSIDKIKKDHGVNWVFHQDSKVDVAIIPFGLDPNRDDVKVIPDNIFLTTGRLFELYDVFFLSYQPGIEPRGRILPIIRSGTISLINEDNTFYVDAFAFPGNSGSPVFVKPSPIRFDQQSISIGNDPLGGRLAGVIGSYIPYQEVAISMQTGRPRVVFEENTGLCHVWSVTFLQQILDSSSFRKQLDTMIKTIK